MRGILGHPPTPVAVSGFRENLFAFFSQDVRYGLNAATLESHFLRQIRVSDGLMIACPRKIFTVSAYRNSQASLLPVSLSDELLDVACALQNFQGMINRVNPF